MEYVLKTFWVTNNYDAFNLRGSETLTTTEHNMNDL